MVREKRMGLLVYSLYALSALSTMHQVFLTLSTCVSRAIFIIFRWTKIRNEILCYCTKDHIINIALLTQVERVRKLGA